VGIADPHLEEANDWRGVLPAPIEEPGLPIEGVSLSAQLLQAELDAFAAACHSGVPPLAGVRHGYEVVRILESLAVSARHGGSVVSLGRPASSGSDRRAFEPAAAGV
ncbi:MAG: hypothetical protein ACRDZX_14800, partial [Acidimicrobiales bacterium]